MTTDQVFEGKYQITVKPADSLSAYLARSCQDVQIRFALIQASGLRAAVRAATGSDADEGITTYATIKTSFLPHPVREIFLLPYCVCCPALGICHVDVSNKLFSVLGVA